MDSFDEARFEPDYYDDVTSGSSGDTVTPPTPVVAPSVSTVFTPPVSCSTPARPATSPFTFVVPRVPVVGSERRVFWLSGSPAFLQPSASFTGSSTGQSPGVGDGVCSTVGHSVVSPAPVLSVGQSLGGPVSLLSLAELPATSSCSVSVLSAPGSSLTFPSSRSRVHPYGRGSKSVPAAQSSVSVPSPVVPQVVRSCIVHACTSTFSGGSFRVPRRHVAKQHLPWWWAAQTACWVCERQFGTTKNLRFHVTQDPGSHPDGAGFSAENARQWGFLVNGLLHVFCEELELPSLSALLQYVRERTLFPTDLVVFRDEEFALLRRYEEEISSIPPSSCGQMLVSPPSRVSCLVHWRTLVNLLNVLPPGRQAAVSVACFPCYPDGSPIRGVRQFSQSAPSDLEFIDSHFHIEKVLYTFGHHSLASLEANTRGSNHFILLRAVANFVFPGISRFVQQYITDSRLVYTVGFHPKSVQSFLPFDRSIQELVHHLLQPSCVGVGEVGLDFTKGPSRALQEEALRVQLPLARIHGKAIVIHARADVAGHDTSAVDAVLAILVELDLQRLPIHLHCFSYSFEVAERWLAACPQVCFGVTSIAMRNPHVADAACRIPLDRIRLESDAPYLPPPGEAPFRNHPWFIHQTASFVAQRRNMPVASLVGRANANACRLYPFPN